MGLARTLGAATGALAVLGAVLVAASDGPEADLGNEAVEVFGNSHRLGFFDAPLALRHASDLAGFEVKSFERAPAGFQLFRIEVSSTREPNTATLKWAQPGTAQTGEEPRTHSYIQVTQLGVRIGAPDDRARRIDTRGEPLEVWHERTQVGVDGYTVFEPDRTYLVIVYPGSGQPSQAEMLKAIRSIR